MVDLNDVRVFHQVATAASFSAAAKHLGISRANVSRSIASLEKQLGVRLVHRTTRKLALTPAGHALNTHSAAALADLVSAADLVEGFRCQPGGLVRVSTAIAFGLTTVVPILPGFCARYPDVRVALWLKDTQADLLSDAVDVAICVGPLPVSNLVCSPLFAINRILCAAPQYLSEYGTPRNLEDLDAHRLIENTTGSKRSQVWEFTCDNRTDQVQLRPVLSVNDAVSVRNLTVQGAGIGLLGENMCAEDIAVGRLVRLLPRWSASPVEVNILFPSRRELAPTVRAFVDFVREASRAASRAGQTNFDLAVPQLTLPPVTEGSLASTLATKTRTLRGQL